MLLRSLWNYFDVRARRFGILELKLFAGAAMFLALIIAKLVPGILQVNVWWFVGLWIGFAARPMVVFYGKDTHR